LDELKRRFEERLERFRRESLGGQGKEEDS
jgi:hypothetical protein